MNEIEEGGFRTIELFGEHLIVSKRLGSITVDKNICEHRGHRYSLCETGKLPLNCPYHGRPFKPGIGGYSFRNVYGFLFLSKHRPTEEDFFAFFTPPQLNQFDYINRMGTRFSANKMTVDAQPHIWMQNTMDIDHVKMVHPELAELLDLDGHIANWFSPNRHTSAHSINVKPDVAKSYSRFFGGNAPPCGFIHLVVYPNLSITNFLGVFFSVETARQMANGIDTEVETKFYFNKNLEISGKLLYQTANANLKLLEEDKKICESWAQTEGEVQARNIRWGLREERIKTYLEISNAWR